MKTIKYIFMPLFAVLVLVGCAKHDFFDENLIVGRIGPQAFWEPASAVVRAGTALPFSIQYFTTQEGVGISHSAVWYDLTEMEEREVFSPFVPRFTFSSSTSELVRISQMIMEFPHSLAEWDPVSRSYRFASEFPVSNTLSPFTWVHPGVFDENLMKTLFGEDFMEDFIEELREIMVYDDYREVILRLGFLESFEQFTDSTFVENMARYVYRFPGDKMDSITGELLEVVVPDEVAKIFDGITFAELITLPDGEFNVTYRRTYRINAIMRVYDTRGVFGLTEPRIIYIN